MSRHLSAETRQKMSIAQRARHAPRARALQQALAEQLPPKVSDA